jgi:uncharacterized membrane protein HdeD (DUF308 family)
VRSLWWLVVTAGLVSLVVGVLALVYPDKTLSAIAVIFGIYLLIVGIIGIGLTLGGEEDRPLGLLVGILAVIAGLIVIRHPGQSLELIALAVGIYLVLAGILRFVVALQLPVARAYSLAVALIDLAAGIVLVAWPSFGVTTFAVVFGIVLLLRGVGEVVVGLGMRPAS